MFEYSPILIVWTQPSAKCDGRMNTPSRPIPTSESLRAKCSPCLSASPASLWTLQECSRSMVSFLSLMVFSRRAGRCERCCSRLAVALAYFITTDSASCCWRMGVRLRIFAHNTPSTSTSRRPSHCAQNAHLLSSPPFLLYRANLPFSRSIASFLSLMAFSRRARRRE